MRASPRWWSEWSFLNSSLNSLINFSPCTNYHVEGIWKPPSQWSWVWELSASQITRRVSQLALFLHAALQTLLDFWSWPRFSSPHDVETLPWQGPQWESCWAHPQQNLSTGVNICATVTIAGLSPTKQVSPQGGITRANPIPGEVYLVLEH